MSRSTNRYSSVDSTIPERRSSGAEQKHRGAGDRATDPDRRGEPNRDPRRARVRSHTEAAILERGRTDETEQQQEKDRSSRMDPECRLNGEGLTLNKLGDIEALTSPSGKRYRSININHYATKKSAAQSMLDVALLMANSSQLKTVLYVGPHYRFYIPLIVLLSLSITLQVIVGLLLVFIVKYDLNDVRKHAKLNRMNNAATVFVFFTVLINIFITALGFEGHVVKSAGAPAMSIQDPLLLPVMPVKNMTGSQ